jgi:hypothetical protein
MVRERVLSRIEALLATTLARPARASGCAP